MADADDDPVVENPTYLGNIRAFFTDDDIDHMRAMGISLGSYAGVRKHASLIHFHTSPPKPDMPLGGPYWSVNRVETFTNWARNGFPLGVATADTRSQLRAAGPPTRERKNVNDLGDDEKQALANAFNGLMARNPIEPDSYFALAGIHGLPNAYCEHHDDPFNPWHRVYLKNFEDALRSIEGCGDVTLPYWDITTPLPDLLQQPPFNGYALPQTPWGDLTPDPSDPPYFPLTTQRNTPDKIASEFVRRGVLDANATSLQQSLWGASGQSGFQKFSIRAHDGGHNSIGPTMADQNIAAYDPVFWFYHCNIDRLFLQWQQKVGATTLNGFESVLAGDIDWLSPPWNQLMPWGTTIAASLDLGISYAVPPTDEEATLENKVGSVEAGRSFSISRSSQVSVRVKGIDRLQIPGSFDVHLLADGEVIRTHGFFQPTRPRQCANCVKNALVNMDFELDQDEILDRKLSVEIEPLVGFEGVGNRFPLAQAGNPTINARLLLEDQ